MTRYSEQPDGVGEGIRRRWGARLQREGVGQALTVYGVTLHHRPLLMQAQLGAGRSVTLIHRSVNQITSGFFSGTAGVKNAVLPRCE